MKDLSTDLPTHCDDVVGEMGTSSAGVYAVRKDFKEEQTSVEPSSQFQVVSVRTPSSLLPSHCVFRNNVSWNFYVGFFTPHSEPLCSVFCPSSLLAGCKFWARSSPLLPTSWTFSSHELIMDLRVTE